MTEIVLTDTAAKIVKADVAADKRDRLRHAEYVKEMGVTLDTVAAHVAIFRDAYKSANKSADSDAVKAYATKVRNGLNRALGKTSEKKDPNGFYLTTEGIDALSTMDAEEMYTAIVREIENRTAAKAA